MLRRTAKLWVLFSVLEVLSSIQSVQSYGTGAPVGAICESMIPKHGVDPQTTLPPYNATVTKLEVKGGEKVLITLSANPGESFKGFFAMVKKAGDNKKAMGKFTNVLTNGKTINCFNSEDSAVTHNSPIPKTSVTVEWNAPNEDLNDLQLTYTFVKNGETFWTHIAHPQKLRVARDANFVSAVAQQKQIGEEARQKLVAAYEGCDAKGCMGIDKQCIDRYHATKGSPSPEVCGAFVTWAKKGDRNVFQLVGIPVSTARGYIAMGLSDDDKMGKDSVVGCLIQSNGQATASRFYNNPSYANEPAEPSNLGLTVQSASLIDGHLFCDFEQTDHALKDINVDFKNSYHFLLARGSSSTSRLEVHDGGKVVSDGKLSMTDVGVVLASNSQLLYKLHGSIMIIAWLICASTGMFTARYYKLTHTEFMPLNKAFWFVVHLFCMFATALFTIAGAVIIIIKVKGYRFKQGEDISWHQVLGTVLFGLAACQVLIAFFRPHPGTANRPIFNWIHWTIGNSAHIIGIACIFLANELTAVNLQTNQYLFVMMGAVIFHIAMHIVMSFHTLWADKQMNSKSKRAVVPGPMKGGPSGEAPGTGFRSFMLVFYFFGMMAFSAALFYFIWRPAKVNLAPES